MTSGVVPLLPKGFILAVGLWVPPPTAILCFNSTLVFNNPAAVVITGMPIVNVTWCKIFFRTWCVGHVFGTVYANNIYCGRQQLQGSYRSHRHVWNIKSQLLFCIRLKHPGQLITKTGYRFRSGVPISHLLYMGDIKLYTSSERETDPLIRVTRSYSEDAVMSFRKREGW